MVDALEGSINELSAAHGLASISLARVLPRHGRSAAAGGTRAEQLRRVEVEPAACPIERIDACCVRWQQEGCARSPERSREEGAYMGWQAACPVPGRLRRRTAWQAHGEKRLRPCCRRLNQMQAGVDGIHTPA